jgi:hypothetical protein
VVTVEELHSSIAVRKPVFDKQWRVLGVHHFEHRVKVVVAYVDLQHIMLRDGSGEFFLEYVQQLALWTKVLVGANEPVVVAPVGVVL